MCALVTVMCVGLVLLGARAATGLVLPPPRAVVSQHLRACVRQCLLRSDQLVLDQGQTGAFSCCNYTALCDKSCRIHFNKESTVVKNEDNGIDVSGIEVLTASESSRVPCSSGECDLPSSAWVLIASCGSCRTKRKLRSPMLREAALIARSVGLNVQGLHGGGESSLDNKVDNNIAKLTESSWNLRLLSMSSGEDVVSTQVAWDPSPAAGPWYLVTWELEGGGLRGNLLTNSTSILLSLWPDTVYHVQISADSTGETSECLVVNTHPPPTSQHLGTLSEVERVAGATAAILVFSAVILLLARRWRYESSTSSKDFDHLREFNHFKLYPPPITLAKDMSPPPPPPAAALIPNID